MNTTLISHLTTFYTVHIGMPAPIKQHRFVLTLLILFLILPLSNHALSAGEWESQTTDEAANLEDDEDDFQITGLMIDETLTKGGHEFYNLYLEKMGTKAARHNIRVTERNDANRSIIIIQLDDETILQANLNPQPDALEGLVKIAVTRTVELMLQQRAISRSLKGL